jgi:hypothetical protein
MGSRQTEDTREMARRSQVWGSVREELREIVWLASIVGSLSIMGVTLAVILSQALARLPVAHI